MALIPFIRKKPSKQRFYLEPLSQVQVSVFTLKKTVYALRGDRWLCRMTWDTLEHDEYEEMMRFVYSCQGQLNTFKVADELRYIPTAYAKSNISGRFDAIDRIQTNSKLDYFVAYSKLRKITSTHTGYAELEYFADDYLAGEGSLTIQTFQPTLNADQATGNHTITPDGKATFRLIDDKQAANFSFNGNIGSGYISMEEAL